VHQFISRVENCRHTATHLYSRAPRQHDRFYLPTTKTTPATAVLYITCNIRNSIQRIGLTPSSSLSRQWRFRILISTVFEFHSWTETKRCTAVTAVRRCLLPLHTRTAVHKYDHRQGRDTSFAAFPIRRNTRSSFLKLDVVIIPTHPSKS